MFSLNEACERYFLRRTRLCTGVDSVPGVYLREDAVSGMSHLENQSEVRAATADVAARLLDAAIAARTVPGQNKAHYHHSVTERLTYILTLVI